jgi:hypothetical protein
MPEQIKRQRRGADVSEEILVAFDRLIEIEAAIEKLEDEHGPLLKLLTWKLMPESGFSEWWIGSMVSPADSSLDRDLAQGSRQPCADYWPELRRDRQVLLAALADWKQRKGS